MVIACQACGQKNRLGASALTKSVRCGRCKTSIGPVGRALEVDGETFDEIVRDATVPVLVDFWAAWCGPCRMAAPEVQKTAEQMAGRAIVIKVDTDRHGEVAQRFGVRGIPNFVVLRHGRTVFQQSGVVPHTEMVRWLENAAA